ncbi:DUF1405 domain-containing protein [Bacillaceae bacterium]
MLKRIDTLLRLLAQRPFLWFLFAINFLGTIYGFFWYKQQLAETSPSYLRLFVPDSPTASGLFTLVLFAYLMGRRFPLLEAFASITNFKYGVWAVVMIVVGWAMGDPVSWTDGMLVVSHAGMAAEAVLYRGFYRYRFRQIAVVAAWTLTNDWLDYSLDIHPWLPGVMEPYDDLFGYFTVLLSLFSLTLFSLFAVRRK